MDIPISRELHGNARGSRLRIHALHALKTPIDRITPSITPFSVSQQVRALVLLFSFHAVMEEATFSHPSLGGEGRRGNTRPPSQQRVCFPPDAVHTESGRSNLRRRSGEGTPPTSYAISKQENIFLFFLYILRMINGPLGPPESMEGALAPRAQLEGGWWACSTRAEHGYLLEMKEFGFRQGTKIQTF